MTALDSASGNVIVSWSAPADGYSEITSYLVEVQTGSLDWHSPVSACPGTDVNLLECTLAMNELHTEEPYLLGFDSLVVARVTASNSYGSALLASPVNTEGVKIRSAPSSMTAPSQVYSTDSTIKVEWQPLEGVQTGNSLILSYNLYWDNGSGVSSIELVDQLVTSFVVTGLEGGINYRFKVRARNLYGYGDFSEEYVVHASDMPGRPVLPVISLTGKNVLISWVAPASHFATIDQYEVLIKKADSSFIEDTSNCDGSDSEIV